ncbi:MAG: hypothetical protein GQ569_03110 [Methylococcaceae bacterium]|nr:hypothetical protein [Methylococcaceae bacterium]
MNISSEHVISLTFMLLALAISGVCLYILLRFSKIAQSSDKKVAAIANQLSSSQVLEKKLVFSHTLNSALIHSIQIKNAIEFATLLLNNCTYKSNVLTSKSIDNSLHDEIKKAAIAVNALEEKRAFLELKIRESYPQLNEKTQISEVEEFSYYTRTLENEMQMELDSIEKIKTDVLKVNEVLDTILLKVAA